MGTTAQSEKSRVESRDAELIASEAFARVFRACIECSDAVQEAIRDMVEIVADALGVHPSDLWPAYSEA